MSGNARPMFFFFREAPKNHFPHDWVRPPDEADYHRDLKAEGFLSPSDDEHYGSLLQRAVIRADLYDLEKHLLPFFWQHNHRARYYRNRYYQYEWIFGISTFFLVLFMTVNIFFYAQGWTGLARAGAVRPTEVLVFLTAIMAGLGAAVRFLSMNQKPWPHWIENRRIAEELRAMYFKFLTHTAPFDGEERVVELWKQTRQAALGIGSPALEIEYCPQFMALLDKETLAPLSKFYFERIEEHIGYFRSYIGYLQYNAEKLVYMESLLLGVTVIIVSYSVLANQPIFSLVAVSLSAVTILIALFRKLYQFEENTILFEQVTANLEQLLPLSRREASSDEDMSGRLATVVTRGEAMIALALNQRR